jgi:hypothetical protein
MKHLKKYPLYESQELKMKEIGIVVDKDPIIKEWKSKAKLLSDWFDEYGDNTILTPYGETIDFSFYPEYEYRGDGYWNIESESEKDRYGISYIFDGKGKSSPHEYPDDVMYDEEKCHAYMGNDEFNPVDLVVDLINKEPFVSLRIYNLCPPEIKKSILAKMKDKNMDINLLKGGSTLNRFGFNDI